MTPMSTTAPSSPATEPQGAYPFGAFAMQAVLGVRLSTPPSRERGGTA